MRGILSLRIKAQKGARRKKPQSPPVRAKGAQLWSQKCKTGLWVDKARVSTQSPAPGEPVHDKKKRATSVDQDQGRTLVKASRTGGPVRAGHHLDGRNQATRREAGHLMRCVFSKKVNSKYKTRGGGGSGSQKCSSQTTAFATSRR